VVEGGLRDRQLARLAVGDAERVHPARRWIRGRRRLERQLAAAPIWRAPARASLTGSSWPAPVRSSVANCFTIRPGSASASAGVIPRVEARIASPTNIFFCMVSLSQVVCCRDLRAPHVPSRKPQRASPSAPALNFPVRTAP
jgi:hypothetical protein